MDWCYNKYGQLVLSKKNNQCYFTLGVSHDFKTQPK